MKDLGERCGRLIGPTLEPDEEALQAVTSMVPLKRWGRASDVGGIMLFLCGLGGNYVTGSIIPLDGGVSTNCGDDVSDPD